MRRWLPLVMTLLAASCGGRDDAGEVGELGDRDVAITVSLGDAEIEFGRAFPITVVRHWRRDLTVDAWSDELLAPLRVVPVASARRDDARHSQESLSFLAYAFLRGPLALPAVPMRARDAAGRERIAASLPRVLDVRSTLGREAQADSAIELPQELLFPGAVSRRRAVLVAAVAIALLAALFVAWRARSSAKRARARAGSTAAADRLSAEARALARLARLREREAEAPHASLHEEAAALLKEFVAERYALPALPMTTEQLATVDREPFESRRAALAKLLQRCDRVKFARETSDRARRAELLEGAERFVRATA